MVYVYSWVEPSAMVRVTAGVGTIHMPYVSTASSTWPSLKR